MRAALSSLLVAAVLVVCVGAASASIPLRLVPAGGASYPQRSFLLSLPNARTLSAAQLRVTENGGPVTSLQVTRAGSSAQSSSAVVLAIDASWSMGGKPIQSAIQAARAFAAARSPNEELAVVSFNHAIDVLQPFTTSSSAISSALANPPKIALRTRIYDALHESLGLIASAHVATGSIVIVTDGSDVGSKVKPAAVLAALGRAHVRVFSVGIPSSTYDRTALAAMASATGGSYVKAVTLQALTPILARIGQQLSSEYLVSYRSLANPKTHITVAVSVRGAPGRATTAYRTPALHIISAAAPSRSAFDRFVASSASMVVVVLVIAALLLIALVSLLGQRNDPFLTRVGGFVSLPAGTPTPKTEQKRSPLIASMRGGLLARAQASARRENLRARLAETLELAEIGLTPEQVVLLTLGAAVLVGIVLFLVVGPVGIPIALVAVPYASRFLVLKQLRKKRNAFAAQLPDNLDVLASALRAGHSLVSALSVVADDAAEPSKSEYQRVIAEEQFGVQLEDALKVTSVRMANRDLEQIALVARLQREMGSNSAEVLDRVIETVRGRTELRRLVRTLTAQGRLSRWILTGLPIGLAVLLTLIDSSYMHPLFHKTLGKLLLGVAVIMVTAGSFIIGKIIDIKA